MSIQQLKNEILIDLEEDYVNIPWIIGFLEPIFGQLNADEVKTILFRAIEELLAEGKIVAGNAKNDGGFYKWCGNYHDWMKRILNDWETRGEPPNIDESVWFGKPEDVTETEPDRSDVH